MSEFRPQERNFSVAGVRFAVVAARWNGQITDGLLAGVERVAKRQAMDAGALHIFRVPGAFELPLAAQQAARSGRFDAVIALGCVVRGDTPHFDYICAETTRGLGQVGLQEALPVTFGLLTTDNLEQALQRSGTTAENKGEEATLTALEMLLTLKNIADNT
ncbi:MAG: 6,7-dimethyl-8-ribityllumazine synthase [Porticoccaceae bacterium]|nr:6,7-dimethyl-8-ribityllumazine synthase [Porticoccaceae bacterium]